MESLVNLFQVIACLAIYHVFFHFWMSSRSSKLNNKSITPDLEKAFELASHQDELLKVLRGLSKETVGSIEKFFDSLRFSIDRDKIDTAYQAAGLLFARLIADIHDDHVFDDLINGHPDDDLPPSGTQLDEDGDDDEWSSDSDSDQLSFTGTGENDLKLDLDQTDDSDVLLLEFESDPDDEGDDVKLT